MAYGGTLFNLQPAFIAGSSRVFAPFDLHFSEQPQRSELGHNWARAVINLGRRSQKPLNTSIT